MRILESGEDYLEAVLILNERRQEVRSVDVATKLGVSKASVCVAMKNLQNGGYIQMDAHRTISLTEKGREVAMRVYERHLVFSKMLVSLGVERETASQDACRMEHAVSEKSFLAIKNYLIQNGMDVSYDRQCLPESGENRTNKSKDENRSGRECQIGKAAD